MEIAKIKCNIHSARLLQPTLTKYGSRYSCPVQGCTVVAWQYHDGKISKPATKETRWSRITAHNYFDEIWKSGVMTRQDAYRRLSEHLGIPPKETHIAIFDAETCEKVILFAKDFE